MRAKPNVRVQRVRWLENACKAKPHIGAGWMGSRLFGMVDGNSASYDTGQSLGE